MAIAQHKPRGASRARNVHKGASPRNRAEEILTRGGSAWDSPNQKLNPNSSYFRTMLKRERGLRWYTTLTFWLALPLLIVAATMYIQAKTEPPIDLADASVPANASDGKETAYAELTSWLKEKYSPLPGAQIVSWDGYTSEEAPKPEKSTEKKLPYRFETHRFTLVQDGNAYQATVQVAVSDTVGAVATSKPSYIPIPKTKALPGGAPVSWFNLESTSAPASVEPAVQDWAEAYASGDGDALRRVVGDPKPDNVYMPLVGVDELVDVTVIDAAYLPDPDAPESASLSERNLGMIARVEVSLWWNGQSRGDENSKGRPTPVTYDVLIENPGTASPRVVAWGAPGDGPNLRAYENALRGITLDQLELPEGEQTNGPDDDGAQPTPSPTKSADGSESKQPSPEPTETEGTP